MKTRFSIVLGCAVLGCLSFLLVTEAAESETPPKATYPLKIPTSATATQAEGANTKQSEAVTEAFKPARRVPPQLRRGPAYKPMTNLVFDAEIKEYQAKPLEYDLSFTFSVTNVSDEAVIIGNVRTSCGCTVAKLPELPWALPPGTSGSFGINMDVRGKKGSVTKSVYITTDHGSKTVYVRGILPDARSMTAEQRKQNQLLAKADRQAVFKGQCASCHATPTKNKSGSALFEVACNICHATAHRAEMVPDLHPAKPGRDYNYWKHWIAEGKEGTLMPAFSKEKGGPLTDAQIISLAHWLTRNYPSTDPVNTSVPAERSQ